MAYEEQKLVKPGDHMVLLYDNDDENSDVISAFLAAALNRNEKCFYISGDANVELMLDKLEKFIDYKNYIQRKQLSIVDKKDAYSKDGSFDPSRMIELLKTLADNAINDGYTAFSITGELSWVLDYEAGFDKIMEYEWKLNQQIFSGYQVSAICRYNINKFSSEMLVNIVQVHPIVIWEGKIHENPYYIDLVENDENDIHDYQIVSMLSNISQLTNVKSRFSIALENQAKEYERLQVSFMESIIFSLTSLLENHDTYTKNHSENVAKIARKIARSLGLSQEEINLIYYAGLVHDIGKTIVPYEIINKTEKLTDEEYVMVKNHSVWGSEALVKSNELEYLAKIVRHHHEAYDGKGYPDQLKGISIPLASRIICVADAYDAMINDRPYRKAMNKEAAIEELARCSGTQFDPEIVEAFLKL